MTIATSSCPVRRGYTEHSPISPVEWDVSQGTGCFILETHLQDGVWLSVKVCWVIMLWESRPPVQGSDGSGVLTGAFTWHSFLKSKSFKATVLRKCWVSVTLSVTEILGFSCSEHGIWTQEESCRMWWRQLDGDVHFSLNLSSEWWLARFLDLCSTWNGTQGLC